MKNIKNTRSKAYIVPLLTEHIDIHKALFVNSYLFDINRPKVNNNNIEGIFLLFSWSNNSIHKIYEEKLIKSSFIKDHYDINDKLYMVFFEFPDDIINDINFIIDGKFSKISIKAKEIIFNYWQVAPNSKIHSILTKSKKYKVQLENELNVRIEYDAELGDKLNYHQETFDQLIEKLVLK